MEKELTTEEIQNKINDYQDIINGFISLLEEENQALRAYNIEAVGQLYERKSKTVGAYRSIVAFFIKHQDYLSSITDEHRAQLKELSLKLDALMKENDTLLKSKMETSQSIMESIVRLAKITNKNNSTSYGAGGSYSKVDNTQSSIAVNRTL